MLGGSQVGFGGHRSERLTAAHSSSPHMRFWLDLALVSAGVSVPGAQSICSALENVSRVAKCNAASPSSACGEGPQHISTSMPGAILANTARSSLCVCTGRLCGEMRSLRSLDCIVADCDTVSRTFMASDRAFAEDSLNRILEARSEGGRLGVRRYNVILRR